MPASTSTPTPISPAAPTLTAIDDGIAVIPDATPERPSSEAAPGLRIVTEPVSTSFHPVRSVLRLFVFAFPFLLIAGAARNSGLLSADHARLLTQALALHRDPALSSIDFSHPPLLALALAVWPNLIVIQYLSALVGGAVAAVLWAQLRETTLNLATRCLLVAAFCATPAVLLVAGMHASDMLALLLLLLAWRSYTQFVHYGITWQGFVAGLLLGLAFFSSFLTLLFVVPFALGAPSYLHSGGAHSTDLRKTGRRPQRHAILAGVVVIAFPGICAALSWFYLSWIGTGSLTHLADTTVSHAFARQQLPGAWQLLRMTGEDLVRQPLYVVVAFLMAQRGLRQLVAHLFPLALVTVPRALGWSYDEGFVAACYLGFAVLGLAVMTSHRPHHPARTFGRYMRAGLAITCVAQLATAVLPLRTLEPQSWRSAILETNTGAISQAARLEGIASVLARQPQGVVLTDYSASEIIARAGTTHPFLLPASDQFQPAVLNPAGVVDHVLLPQSVESMPSGLDHVRSAQGVPGFHLDVTQAGWQIFTRNGAGDLAPSFG